MTHCWKDKAEFMEETYGYMSTEHLSAMIDLSATCMLPDGHECPHEFVGDDRIGVTFIENGKLRVKYEDPA